MSDYATRLSKVREEVEKAEEALADAKILRDYSIYEAVEGGCSISFVANALGIRRETATLGRLRAENAVKGVQSVKSA